MTKIDYKNVNIDSLIEANNAFKQMVDEMIENLEEFISDENRWAFLLKLRDRLKDSNTTNEHVKKFNSFIIENIEKLHLLPSDKERPHFYWWNHLDLIKDGKMEINLDRADVIYQGLVYSTE